MKILVFLITLAIFNSSYITAQTEEDMVKLIRQQFKTINDELKSYRSEFSSGTDEESGADWSVNEYFKGEQLMKVEEKYFGDMTENYNQYYYWNNQLFFIFTNYTYYMPDESGSIVTENRYYFNKNKLIRWLDSEKIAKEKNTDDFKDNEKLWLEKAVKFLTN